jgi:hypothetical protein
MGLASVCLKGIHRPENIQNGNVQGGNASHKRAC